MEGIFPSSPSPGDLLHQGIKPGSPALQVDSLPAKLLGKPIWDGTIPLMDMWEYRRQGHTVDLWMLWVFCGLRSEMQNLSTLGASHITKNCAAQTPIILQVKNPSVLMPL